MSLLCRRKWISTVIYVNSTVQNGNEGHKPLYLWKDIQL